MLIKFDFSSKKGVLVVKFAFATAIFKIETWACADVLHACRPCLHLLIGTLSSFVADEDENDRKPDSTSHCNAHVQNFVFVLSFPEPFGRVLVSAKTRSSGKHSGQMSAHAQGLSTSGQLVVERTVRGFVNKKIVGNLFFVDESLHYLNARPRMNEDLYGSKCKRRVPV